MRAITRSTPALFLLAGIACAGDVPPTDPTPPALDARLRQSIAQWGVVPILPVTRKDPAKVALGRALFFDPILSGNRDIACATCHHPGTHAGDGLSLAIGTGGTGSGTARALGTGREFVPRNAPTLLNQGLGAFYANWDGRVSGAHGFFQSPAGAALPPGLDNLVAAQAMFPVTNRREMRGEPGDRDILGTANELASIGDDAWVEIWTAIMKRLLAVPGYAAMFQAAYPTTPRSSLAFAHAANAIAAFQIEELTTMQSPFDRYLARDDAALTTEAKQGAILFFGEARCGSCHNGPFLGAQQFANAGVPQIGPGMHRSPPLDLGRAEMDDFPFYRFAFRVPALRNVELTAPYMHNGAYTTLEAVIDHYDDVVTALRTYDASQLEPSLRSSHHGDEATVADILHTLDPRLRIPLDFTDAEKRQLIAFLKSFTDPAARELGAITPAAVPSGLPLRH